MVRRLRGLFVIVRTLLPFLLILGVAMVTWIASRAVADATQDYADRVGGQLSAIQVALDEANDGLQAVAAYVTSSAAAAEELLARVGELRNRVDITLPSVEIPDFDIPLTDVTIRLPEFQLGDGVLTIPIPGVEALQRVASDLVAAGRRAVDPVLKLGALAQVPPQLGQVAEDTAEYAGDVRSALSGWLLAMFLVLALAGVTWLVAALRPIAAELSRGWAMLRGRPSPERAVAGLERRVADLERRVAGRR